MYFFKINLNLNQIETKDIRISDNVEYTCLKLDNEIIILSNQLGLPIASLNLINGKF